MTSTAAMFDRKPEGLPSLTSAYEQWARAHTPIGTADPAVHPRIDPTTLSVGIVGGGISGLYAAMRLQSLGASVHVFEANPGRVGGRVYTHRFTADPNQYFEAGAMRLPMIPEQQPVFDLIDSLNRYFSRVDPVMTIQTMPYVLFDAKGNDLVSVNGMRGPDGKPMTAAYAAANPGALGFSLAATDGKTAQRLILDQFGPLLARLKKDFEAGFQEIVKYDDYSFRSYLAQVAGWSDERINYVEVMTSQTNQFQNSFTELLIENMDFAGAAWKTIKNGMDILPRALAMRIGQTQITLGARVTEVGYAPEGLMTIALEGDPFLKTFHKILLAVPPAALRMISTPRWSPQKTHAIRSLHFEPLYKIGMRFTTRFWEQLPVPAMGGQSITDLPSRWIVYPSYGIGDRGPGALLLYSWMTDAVGWLPMPEAERIRLALRDLQLLYGDQVDVASMFIEAFDVNWTEQESTGDAMFFPGQFKNLFNIARQSEGGFYFAGEHLSVHHTWIAGALDSALHACRQMLGMPELTFLPGDTGDAGNAGDAGDAGDE